MAAGLAVLRRLDRSAGPGNPMNMPTPESVGLGLLIVWMGPASMLEHGTLTTTWGWFDATSIHWLGTYVTGYLLLRASPWRDRAAGRVLFAGGLAVTWTAIGVWTWDGPRAAVSVALLALMGTALLLAPIAGRLVGLRFEPRVWPRLGALVACFGAAMACLALGGEGRPLAPWGHGAWHLLCGAATLGIVEVLRAEAQCASAA